MGSTEKRTRSVLEKESSAGVYKVIRDVVNPSLEIGIGERDYYPNQVMRLTADISELTEDTGFVPEIDFAEGIRRTMEWYKGEVK